MVVTKPIKDVMDVSTVPINAVYPIFSEFCEDGSSSGWPGAAVGTIPGSSVTDGEGVPVRLVIKFILNSSAPNVESANKIRNVFRVVLTSFPV